MLIPKRSDFIIQGGQSKFNWQLTNNFYVINAQVAINNENHFLIIRFGRSNYLFKPCVASIIWNAKSSCTPLQFFFASPILPPVIQYIICTDNLFSRHNDALSEQKLFYSDITCIHLFSGNTKL